MRCAARVFNIFLYSDIGISQSKEEYTESNHTYQASGKKFAFDEFRRISWMKNAILYRCFYNEAKEKAVANHRWVEEAE